MKKINKKSFSYKSWLWLGRQNVFVVFFVLLSILFLGSRVYANYFSANDNSNTTLEQVEKDVPSTVKPTAKPSPTASIEPLKIDNSIDCKGPDGVIFKATKQECDDFNKAWGNIAPIQEKLINCTFPDNSECGGQLKKVTADECKNLRCCKNYSSNEYVIDTQKACDNFFQEELDRVNHINNEKLEKYYDDLDKYQNQVDANNCTLMIEANNVQSQNLEACRNWVRNNIPRTIQIGVGNPQDNPAYSSAYTQCFDLYGTDPYPEVNENCSN